MHHNPEAPVIKEDPMYRLLREGKVDVFNAERARGRTCDLTRCDFRGLDLRGLNADGLDLSNAYFRQADLRGVNLSNARLVGASLHAAKIAGAYFPPELSAEELSLSLLHGTRMRYSARA